MFDFDDLERQERRSAMHNVSVFKLKAMAMKFRHNTVGYTFARDEKARERHGRRVSKGNIYRNGATAASPLLQADVPDAPDVKMPEFASSTSGIANVVVGPRNIVGLKAIFLHPFCLPLVCAPLGILSEHQGWGPTWTFWLNFLALIPLAKILGDATEEVAAALQNDTLSGLLNATFGNAVEMIVSVQSLRAGLFNVVKASLLGSVLSNILLVLGSSFFLGGWTLSSTKKGKCHSFRGNYYKRGWIGFEKEQKFPLKAALISIGMLFFACMVVVLPTLFNAMPTDNAYEVLKVSRIGSWITMSSYIMYLAFQLLTHKVTLAVEERMGVTGHSAADGEDALLGRDDSDALGACGDESGEGDDDDEASPSLDVWVALMLMALSTVVVAVNSELLVGSIETVVKGSNIPVDFIGVILLPIAGNACEHASALRFSMRDRPGLAIGIAVGSSTQVALLVIPFSVLVAEALGQPLDLDFGILNVAVLTFSVLVVFVLLLDGRSNWLKGYILVAMYVFIAALYLYIPPSFGDGPGVGVA